jgi:hypothetical protein
MHNQNRPQGGGGNLDLKDLFVGLLLADSQETVTWVFFDFAVGWQVSWLTLCVLLYFSEEVDSLWFAATESDSSLV